MPLEKFSSDFNSLKSNVNAQYVKRSLSFITIRNYISYIFFILLMTFLIPSVSFTQTTDKFLKNDDPDKPWNIAADELNYDQETGVYSAKGRVTISKLDTGLTAKT